MYVEMLSLGAAAGYQESLPTSELSQCTAGIASSHRASSSDGWNEGDSPGPCWHLLCPPGLDFWLGDHVPLCTVRLNGQQIQPMENYFWGKNILSKMKGRPSLCCFCNHSSLKRVHFSVDNFFNISPQGNHSSLKKVHFSVDNFLNFSPYACCVRCVWGKNTCCNFP